MYITQQFYLIFIVFCNKFSVKLGSAQLYLLCINDNVVNIRYSRNYNKYTAKLVYNESLYLYLAPTHTLK